MNINKLKIEMILVRKGMSRNDLAEAYGVTSGRISTMLNSRTVRTSTAIRLADILGVDGLNTKKAGHLLNLFPIFRLCCQFFNTVIQAFQLICQQVIGVEVFSQDFLIDTFRF